MLWEPVHRSVYIPRASLWGSCSYMEALGNAVAYWLSHPWQTLGIYLLAIVLSGLAKALGRDLGVSATGRDPDNKR